MSAPTDTSASAQPRYQWCQRDVHRHTHTETFDVAAAIRRGLDRQGWSTAVLWDSGPSGPGGWRPETGRYDMRVVASRPLLRRKLMKLDPDLADGEHWTIARHTSEVMDPLHIWFDEGQVGESITIEIVAMTDREVEELPDI